MSFRVPSKRRWQLADRCRSPIDRALHLGPENGEHVIHVLSVRSEAHRCNAQPEPPVDRCRGQEYATVFEDLVEQPAIEHIGVRAIPGYPAEERNGDGRFGADLETEAAGLGVEVAGKDVLLLQGGPEAIHTVQYERQPHSETPEVSGELWREVCGRGLVLQIRDILKVCTPVAMAIAEMRRIT